MNMDKNIQRIKLVIITACCNKYKFFENHAT